MAGHRFRGADRNLVGLLAKNLFDRLGFADVAETGGSGVGIDVIDVAGRDLWVVARHFHGARGAFAIFRWRGHVVGVRRKSVAGKLAINFRAALLRVFELFHNDNSSAFAYNEAVTVAIERARRTLRFVIALAERFHRGKTGET